MCTWAEHEAAVARLKASYARIPADQQVRLAKKTSNLFRPRETTRTHGLDVSGLTDVIAIDVEKQIADVQGMCTYEHLVDVTLRHGLIPTVVPQLRTITLGGAVTGLGIESTSLRLGLPHESVIEMDVLTGSGDVVTATPTNEHAALFNAFPNSYGSLGYAVRLQISLQPATHYVELRHHLVPNALEAAAVIHEVARTGEFQGVRVDAIDGTVFSPREIYLTLAHFTNENGPVSDYTRHKIYYKSVQEIQRDRLTMHDYLWRWDTDWFWCSRAFGAQNPIARRVWPRHLRRSDVYHRLVALDSRIGASRALDKLKGIAGRERVVQDIEVPVARLADFLDWFDTNIGMGPVWICPLRTGRDWSTYPLEPGEVYVNVGFWGTVEVPAESEPHRLNRMIEREVDRLGGHKSLYSESFYPHDEFDRLYGTTQLDTLRETYDPQGRLKNLYDKTVRNQ